MNRIDIAREGEIHADPSLLDGLWSARKSFLILPSRTGVTPEWLLGCAEQLPDELCCDHFALLTSGSTGQPKLVVCRKERAERLVEVIHAAQQNEPAKQTIGCLPLSYSYALINQWLWSRQKRRELVLTSGLTCPDEMRTALQHASEAIVCMVGAQVPLLAAHFQGACFSGIIRLNFAGGRFPQEHLPMLSAMFPNALIFNNYGCTEAMPRLTVRLADDSEVAVNIGKPLPGVELMAGPDGELLFRSAYRAVAVFESGALHIITEDEWIDTGDLGCRDMDGTWRLLGRKSEVFKRFGEKVSLPALQETVLRNWEHEIACYREVDCFGEQSYVLVLAPHPGKSKVKQILLALRQEFSRAHWPIRIESVHSMPRNGNNKIDAQILQQNSNATIQWTQRLS